MIPSYLALFIVFAGSRWVTYVGLPPLFLTDVLLFSSTILGIIYSRTVPQNRGTATSGVLHYAVTIFTLYACVRAVFSVQENGVSIDLIRDFSPFLYIIVYFLARSTIAGKYGDGYGIFKFLKLSFLLHLIWVSFSVLSGNIFGFFQGSFLLSAGIFSVRPDFDSAMISVYVALLLVQLFEKFNIWDFIYLALGIITVTSLQTRAGLISLLTCLFIAMLHLGKQGKLTLTWTYFLGTILVAFPTVFAFSPAVNRLLVSLGIFNDANAGFEASSFGTITARNLVWQGVLDWTSSNDIRNLFGSGFGINFLVESRTLIFLDDTQLNGVRSPHNWFLGIYARLGVFGFLLAALIFVMGLLIALRRIYADEFKDLNKLSALILGALLPVALFGVVLESPFGAIPFYWALGIISSNSLSKIPIDSDKISKQKARKAPPKKESHK